MSRKLYIVLLISLLSLSVNAQSVKDVIKFATIELADGAEKLQLDNQIKNIGVISEDDKPIEGQFALTNLSDSPLIVTRVVSSCSCLVVDYPKQPVRVKQETNITFKYHPKGYPGPLQRRIFVYTNLSDKKPSAILQICGEVKKSRDPSINYRFVMDQLYLKQNSVTFRDGRKPSIESINCYNASDRPLRLKAMAGFLPKGLYFYTEPEVIESHCEGRLIIKHNPEEWSGAGVSYKVIVDGLYGRPSQRSIDVNFEYKK